MTYQTELSIFTQVCNSHIEVALIQNHEISHIHTEDTGLNVEKNLFTVARTFH